MTREQQREYDSLPIEAKEDYDYTKKRHPNWSHEQIMTKVGMNHKLEDMIGSKGGKDVDPTDPDVLVKILEGGKRFLERLGINIGRIMDVINGAIATLKNAINLGLKYLADKATSLIGWLFD